MDDYVRYLIIVGAIVLVITLILFYIMFSYSKASNTWPPEEMPCPDYWKTSYEEDGLACQDIYHLTSRDDNNKSITYVDVADGDGDTEGLNKWYLNGPATTVGEPNGFVRGDLTDISYGNNTNIWQTHCGKKIWAQHNGVSWDGITNSNIHCTESGYLKNPDNIYDATTV